MDPNAQKSEPASDARKRSAPRPPKFDTMRAVGNLKEAEFREQQAVAIVETIRDAQVEFATRDDLHAGLEKLELVLRGEIGELRSEIQDQFATMYWRFLIGAGIAVSIIVGILGIMITLANGT